MNITTPLLSEPCLDDDQSAVLKKLLEMPRVMVEAPPGTGKTFVGVCAATQACSQGRASRDRPALFLTFSRNARAQIDWEINRHIRNGWLTNNEHRAFQVSNYHAFYFEILRKRAGIWGRVGDLKPAAIAEGLRRYSEASDKLRQCSHLADKAGSIIEGMESLFLAHDTSGISSEMAEAIADGARTGLKSGRPHYDDFAPLFRRLLAVSSAILTWLRVKYPFVILDEFQDTDDTQWEILRLWQPASLLALYDRHQMIYEWRHASPSRPQQLASEFGIDTRCQLQLATLHRSETEKEFGEFILELRADNLLGAGVSPKETRPWLRMMPSVTSNRHHERAEQRCLKAVRRAISTSGTTGIITHTNDLAEYLRRRLSRKPATYRASYFPCSLIGGDNSPDEGLRDAVEKLRHVQTQLDVKEWVSSILDRLLLGDYQVNGRTISLVSELTKPAPQLFKRYREPTLDMIWLRYRLACWWDDPVMDFRQMVIEGLQFATEASRKLTEGRAYPDRDMAFYVRRLVTAANSSGPEEPWSEFCDRLESAILSGTHFIRSTPRDSGVFALTAHQSKGWGFDHVILPWLSDTGEPFTKGSCYRVSQEGDRRLLYVALTRAKSRVTIIYPQEKPARILSLWKLLRAEPMLMMQMNLDL